MKLFKILLFVISLSASFYAQEINKHVNNGVEMYLDTNYSGAAEEFQKGLLTDSNNYEANYNLGNSFYRMNDYEKANEYFDKALKNTKDKKKTTDAFLNKGNSFLSNALNNQANREELLNYSIDAYKEALKQNPKDEEAKYNLSYARKLLNKEKNENKDKNKDNKQNKDKDKKENKDKNKDNKDKNDKDKNDKDKQNGDKDKKNDEKKNDEQNNSNGQKNDKKDEKNKGEKPDEKRMIPKQEADRILDAIKRNEKNIKKNPERKSNTTIKPEKDW